MGIVGEAKFFGECGKTTCKHKVKITMLPPVIPKTLMGAAKEERYLNATLNLIGDD